MKRSRSIRLVLLGSVGLIGLAGCDQPDPMENADFIRDSAACEKTQDRDACRQALADARERHYRDAPRFASRAECEAKMGPDNCELATPANSTTSSGSSSSSRIGGTGFASGSGSSSSSSSSSSRGSGAADGETSASSSSADAARSATTATAADATSHAAAAPHATSSGGYFVPMMMGYMMGRTTGGMATAQPVYRDASNTAYSGGQSIGAFRDHSLSSTKSGSRSTSSSSSSRGGFGSSSSHYSSSS